MSKATAIEGAGSRGSWLDAAKVYWHPRILMMFILGFSAGLPFLLVFGTLSARLREAGIDRGTIGLISYVGTFYAFKFLWAPVVDRLEIPGLSRLLGRRRAWMLVAQAGIALGLLGIGMTDPTVESYQAIVYFALVTAFASATYDIVLDAYRIEIAPPEIQGAMSGTYIAGYRAGLYIAGAGALYLAEFVHWHAAYFAMAACMLPGLIAVFFAPQPMMNVERAMAAERQQVTNFLARRNVPANAATIWFYGAVICPFVDFVDRYRTTALMILALIALYKISDVVMGVMANTFYIDLGFTKDQIATYVKTFGIFPSIAGGLLGGLLVYKMGLARSLPIGALLVAAPNIFFALLALAGPEEAWLIATILADNLGSGMAGGILVAYLSSLTSVNYTATQYALFSSFMSLPGRFIGGLSGYMVDGMGYFNFFVATALMGLPAFFLALYMIRQHLTGEKLSLVTVASKE